VRTVGDSTHPGPPLLSYHSSSQAQQSVEPDAAVHAQQQQQAASRLEGTCDGGDIDVARIAKSAAGLDSRDRKLSIVVEGNKEGKVGKCNCLAHVPHWTCLWHVAHTQLHT
jgi:hypothetical protein